MTTLRQRQLDGLDDARFDVVVVGAGINGAVSAAALAARGVRVALLEERDFAGFTSSQSSNLAWGGIKYLEGWEIGLVNDLCASRNRLVEAFPGMVREVRFVANVERGFRYRGWMLLAGAWAYWLLGRGMTRVPRRLRRREVERRFPAVSTERFAGCVEYSDAFLYDNDARFVFGFVRRALDAGATVANYVAVEGAERDSEGWVVDAVDRLGGRRFRLRADALVNAAGAYVDALNERCGITTRHRHVFSKGIHLVVDRIGDPEHVLAFFADDGRLFFAIPMGARTCLGTTDTRVADPVATVTDADRHYLLDNINRRLRLARPLGIGDVIAERCGVRPLAVEEGAAAGEDFLQLSRRHVIESSLSRRHLSVFGGKLTDCVNVGEEVCEQIGRLGLTVGPVAGRWYGEPGREARAVFFARAARLEAGLGDPVPGRREGLADRLWRRYGEDAHRLLDRIESDPAQADPLVPGASYRRCELALAHERELVTSLEDFLRRRSRIAMVVREEALRTAPGVREACRVLFGADADRYYDAYFGADAARSRRVSVT